MSEIDKPSVDTRPSLNLWPESVEYPFRGGFRSRDKRDIVFSGRFVFLPRRDTSYNRTPGTVKSGIFGIIGIPSCGQPIVELEKSVGKSMTLAWGL